MGILSGSTRRVRFGQAIVPEAPYEKLAQRACQELLTPYPGYQGTFSFGMPGGNDVDLRMCFADLAKIPQEEIRRKLTERLRKEGVPVDLDLLFMTGREFKEGIRDLVELGEVEQRLKDGFDPHERQAAVGDTSMFSLYIFSTMRLLHLNATATGIGTPEEALDRLVLTRDGAVGWMHYYTGCFLHEYLSHKQDAKALAKYHERLAKFLSRVIGGSTLARLDPPQLAVIKPMLKAAIQAADMSHSTDAKMSGVLMSGDHTAILLDMESRDLLTTAGGIRDGGIKQVPADFIPIAEARLFYEAFQQGIDRRPETGEDADPLTSYALGELVRDLGKRVTYLAGEVLMAQGAPGNIVAYIPLKTQAGRDNASADITVRSASGNVIAAYTRTPGRVVGEGAIFGLPRSATVTARDELEAYVIDASAIRGRLTDSGLVKQLKQPVLATREARRLDVLLRYFAREAGIFTRQTLPYTTLADRQAAQVALGDNPLAAYNLGRRFHDVLELFAHADQTAHAAPVTILKARAGQPRTLFKTGDKNDRLYVVSEGTVDIALQNGHETITLHFGEFFGESSLLGLSTTGTAILPAGSTVLAADAGWFKRFTQSRQPISGVPVPPELRDVLPVHLLYHLAAEGYDRVRRRLATQEF